MYQLKNLIHRTAVPNDPQDNMKAAEGFLLLLLHAHILHAATTIQSFLSQELVLTTAEYIINNYVLLSADDNTSTADLVHLYAKEVLTLALLWFGFHDAIKEGDGKRILRYWKFLLVVFKVGDRHNYAKEAVNLLLQYKYLLSPRKAAQLAWSRCVNTTGKVGGNIPCDLHLEHLNRTLKSILSTRGSNINATSIIRAGQTVSAVHRICQVFEKQTLGKKNKTSHPYPSFEKDLKLVLSVLKDENVFVPLARRCHASIKLKCGVIQECDTEKLLKKVQTTIDQLLYR